MVALGPFGPVEKPVLARERALRERGGGGGQEAWRREHTESRMRKRE